MTARGTAAKAKRVRTTQSPSRTAAKPRTLGAQLAEARDQQMATAEILRVISRSRADVQPVFETIAAAARKLCRASSGHVVTFDGELIHLAALANLNPGAADALRRIFPRPPSRDIGSTRAVLTGRIVEIPDVLEDREYAVPGAALSAGYRSVLAVPLIREGTPIGAIGIARPEPGPFPETQIELLQTFADQAVIAIENARLFNETKEALDQQTATARILQAISSSPGDLTPVLETVVRAAAQFCNAPDVLIMRLEHGVLRGAAAIGPFADVLARGAGSIQAIEIPLRMGTVAGRSALQCRSIHVHDLAAEREDEYPEGRELQRRFGHRTIVSTPLLREGLPLGVIVLFRTVVKPFSDKQLQLLQTFADQAVIAIENVRLFKELEQRNNALAESLEQQTTTSEILRVISESPTDVQPVLDTIAAAALKLCGAASGSVLTFDGELVHQAALANVSPEGVDALRNAYPRPPSRDTAGTRSVLERSVVAIPDVLEDRDYLITGAAIAGGFRAVLAVPLIREGSPIGAIAVGRPEPGPFPDKQVALLKTFADQAVIAIENVRLFKELEQRNNALEESLEQQTATSDILRVISQSPTDVQPVFDTIATASLKLCNASTSVVTTYDGKLIHAAALANVNPEGAAVMRQVFPRPPSRENATARAILTRSIVATPDVLQDPEYTVGPLAATAGFRSVVAVPLIRDGNPIGAITVGRPQPGTFPDAQVELLKTFADQAVIAIENVRLFTELGERNRDLTEALEQQTATSDILRVISSSPTDVQPVFDTIARAALDLCRVSSANVFTYDGELVHLAAFVNVDPVYIEALRSFYPRPLGRDTAVLRAIQSRSVIVIPDVLEDKDYVPVIGALATAGHFRSVLAVPLMREGNAIGGIALGRAESGPFPEQQIALLQTFADQAVIAIENVRLFTELEARTTELTQSVGELKALGDVGQAVSSTLDLETVLATIVSRATKLAGMDGGSIYEYDEGREEFHLRTTDGLPEELIDALRSRPIPKGEGAVGRMAVTGAPVELRDITVDRSYQSRVREGLIRLGYHALLAVPLLREDHLLGGLVVNRKRAGEFMPREIDLLKTFASQSALAIQNARLFREIEIKSAQLETASRHKSEFLANMSHELRTPLNAIIGFSEVLSEQMFGTINDKQAEYLKDILESGRHLLSLINDILDLSKIEAGRMELEPSDFDLPGTIENALILVRERANRHGITLAHTVDERLGPIRADERKVKQVLLNLLSNALKFTPEGGRIDVRARVQNGAAEISVTDTGIGIAPEDQAAVFEEFRQVGTASKKVEGTGLGLAISRKFIELHGGTIGVTSEPGVGSTFAFTLPLP
jgi:two-component system, NtrC family, sensor kinase